MQSHSEGTPKQLEDVTARFRAAAHALPSGYLVKAPESPVVDIMNAIEIGASRIDTGMITIDVQSDDLECSHAKDVCDAIDQMCHVEMACLAGSTLLQTVYTSVYYHNPELAYRCSAPEPLPRMLRAYSLAFAKSVELAYYELHKGHAKDIEDCWMESFGVAVKLDDWVEDVLRELERARRSCEDLEAPWREQLDQRLAVRREYLKLLDHHPDVDMRILTNVPLENKSGKGIAIVAPRLRQNMPLPRTPEMTAEQSQDLFISLVIGLGNLRRLRGGRDDLWRVAIWRNSRKPTPSLVRSTFKSAMVDSSQRYGGTLADESLYAFLHQGFDTISALRVIIPPYKQEEFDMWLHSLRSDAIEMLCAPLHNPARQKRTYDKLTFDWAARAGFIGQVDSDSCRRLAVRLHTIRIDCLLESAILALELELIGKGEAAEHYWWLYSICSARLNFTSSGTEGWWIQYVTAWGLIAAAMFQRTVEQSQAPSFRRFVQRHKWALKRPSSSGTLFQPSFEAWCRARERLLQQPQDGEFAERSFDKAVVHLDRFTEPVERSSLTANFHHAMSDLRAKVLDRFGTTTRDE